jgi:hypothetical protein
MRECWHCRRSEIEKPIVEVCDCLEDACPTCARECEQAARDEREGFVGEMAEDLE